MLVILYTSIQSYDFGGGEACGKLLAITGSRVSIHAWSCCFGGEEAWCGTTSCLVAMDSTE